MSVLIAAGSAVLMLIFAKGIHDLQWWLEHSSYRRHFED